MNDTEERDDWAIELGVASKDTRGGEGVILEFNQSLMRLPGISAD
jgi:hypothetical protein